MPHTPPRRSTLPILLALLALAGAAGPALAQGTRQVEAERSERALDAASRREWAAGLRFYGEYIFESDLDDDEGKVSVARGGGVLEVDAPVGDRSRLSFTLQSEYSSYSFDNAQGFAQGFEQPWDDVLENSISAIFTTQPSDHWSYLLGAGARSSAERGADFDDSITGQGLAGFNYVFSKNFNAGLGIVVRSQLEDDVSVLPIILFDWRINDKWRFNGKAGGPGVQLSYLASDALTLSLEADYQSRAFRLDDDGPAPNGVGREERFRVALAAEWRFAKQMLLRARAGLDPYQDYELLDSGGVQVTDRQADAAPFVGLEFRFDF